MESEWEIEPNRKHYLKHNNCSKATPIFSSTSSLFSCNDYPNKNSCWKCKKPIPKYILFQWRLLNGKY